VGYHISDTTVGNILKQHGIEPAPTRQRTGSWETFLKSHWDVMAAIDFTTVEVWTKKWPGHFLSSIRHGAKNSPRALCRLHHQSARSLDETNGANSPIAKTVF
jgi:hypothetical protein